MNEGKTSWTMTADLDSRMEGPRERSGECAVYSREKDRTTQRKTGVETIWDVMRRGRLSWHGHVEQKAESERVEERFKVMGEGTVLSAGRREGRGAFQGDGGRDCPVSRPPRG